MLTIGTRGSPLALAQAQWVRKQILDQSPNVHVQVKVIKTAADRNPTASIRSGSATGVWVKEIEEALMMQEIDIAVHSMKDVPTKMPEGLEIGVIPVREDARDALIAAAPVQGIEGLPRGAVVGTGSVRRQAQLLKLRPDLRVVDIRGNVDTRLLKLQNGEYHAIILACAGLHRLGLAGKISARLEFSLMLPAPGQGALALETRKQDARVLQAIAFLHDNPTATAILAERAFLRRLGGGCNSPVAVYACLERELIKIEGLVATPDGNTVIRETIRKRSDAAEGAAVELANRLLEMGAKSILAPAR